MPTHELESKFYTVPDALNGERLDVCLAVLDNALSRSRIQKLIKDGFVKVSGEVCKTPRAPVKPWTRIDISIPAPEAPEYAEGEKIPLKVLFEDEWMLVIDKPAGMVVHPAAGNWTGTVVNAILGREPELADDFEDAPLRPGIVHRLDKDTSGCLIVAKSAEALTKLSTAFSERRVSKTYMAIVAGWPRKDEERICNLIGRHPADRKRMAVLRNRGREAISIYKTVRKGEIDGVRASLLEVRIFTGRTHQIRVHMAHIGCPVAGDEVYGGAKRVPAPRQMLHAWKIEVPHPFTGKLMKFRASYPKDFKKLMDKLPKPGEEEF